MAETICGFMTITFLFPHPADGPTGGYKVVYEYANRLVADGYKVHIVYAGSLFWTKKNLYFKITNCVRYLQRLKKGYLGKEWFPIDKRVKEHFTFSLNQRHVPQADAYICTSPYTAMYLKNYIADKKIYFIQDYENWGNVTDEVLRTTYHYPLKKIVISKWLKRLIEEEEHESTTLIPNGFDFEYFKLSVPIEKKERYRVTMLYHEMDRKDCATGFRALGIVKQRIPQLRVNLFGAFPKPTGLQDWYDYYQSPDCETHNRIYNEAAIFLGTSKVEGWGLTVGEAMICGQAVVCTDNLGYKEMAIDGVNALILPIGDANALAEAIILLMTNDELRCRIAHQAHEQIKRFSWDVSYLKLKELLNIQ